MGSSLVEAWVRVLAVVEHLNTVEGLFVDRALCLDCAACVCAEGAGSTLDAEGGLVLCSISVTVLLIKDELRVRHAFSDNSRWHVATQMG